MILLIDLRQFSYGTLETRRELRPKCIPQLFLCPSRRATAEHLSSCLVSPGGRALANFALPGGQAFALNPEVTGCVIMTIR